MTETPASVSAWLGKAEHDIAKLLELAAEFAPQLDAFRADCEFLSPLAVVSRYPGYDLASPEADGKRSLDIARRVRSAVRPLITPPANA